MAPRLDTQGLFAALSGARTMLWTDGVVVGLARGKALGLQLAAVAAVLGLLWNLYTASIAWHSAALDLFGLLGLAGSALVLGLAIKVLPRFVRMPSAAAAAAALDAASGGHDRLRIALAYAAREDRLSAFEQAALEDGLRYAREIHATKPLSDEPLLMDPRALGKAFAIIAISMGLALSIPREARLGATGPGLATADAGSVAEAPRAAAAEVALRPDPKAPETPRERAAPRDAERAPREAQPNASESAPLEPDEGGERAQASGRPGKGRPMEARRARQSAASQGDPTDANDAPKDLDPEARPRPTTKPKEDVTKVVPQRKKEEQPSGATVGTSGSGGGAMSPVPSPWTARDASRDQPLPDVSADQELDDEIEEDEARSGTQPALKDRRGATSRDLSISGAGDEPGDGRGGPSQPKKARGTAALILGVPLPDFVRGQLNPGTTKVTHQRVDPVPGEGPVAAAQPIAPRTSPEVFVPHAAWSPARAALVRDALLRFRSLRP